MGDKITVSNVENYKKVRERSKARPATINRELAVLSHIFTKAIEWRWIEKRPVTIRRLKQDQGRLIYLTAEQASRLLEVAKQDVNPQIYLFIVIGLETSMRMMEILSIKLSN